MKFKSSLLFFLFPIPLSPENIIKYQFTRYSLLLFAFTLYDADTNSFHQ